jgi:hypothetical protein
VVEIPAATAAEDRYKDVMQTQVVQPLPQHEPALAGSLSDQNLAQIIQYLNTNSKTGELVVRGKNREGIIAFDKGLIVSAQSADRNGVVAIYAVARERSGSFSFKAVVWMKPNSRGCRLLRFFLAQLFIVTNSRWIAPAM